MNRQPISTTKSNLDKLALLKDIILGIASVLVIIVATLYPFNFSFHDSLSLREIVANFNNSSPFKDRANNILLFMPLGFCFAALFQRVRMKWITKLLIVVLISAGLSTLVEILQVFLPSRSPTPADIFNNTTGGLLGIICFNIWHSKQVVYMLVRIENSRTSYSPTKLILFFIGYVFIAFLLCITWQGTTLLSNWGLNYPLLLGNEQTGDRPWQGYIYDLNIADKAISPTEVSQILSRKNYLDTLGDSLIASYELTGNGTYKDRTGKLPELLPKGELPDNQGGEGIALSSTHWLETGSPVTPLSKRLRETSQFTIITTIASADINQTGPARIISLSNDTVQRNFTLGQEENRLDLRLRTPITGENGSDIGLYISDVFSDTKPHQIVITYSKANVQVYVDNVQNAYSMNLLDRIPKDLKMFYYGISFIPMGVCLAFLTTLAKRKLTFYRLFLLSGILLPSLMMEVLLVSDTGKNLSLKNMLLGILFTAGTMLILRLQSSALVKKVA